MTGRPQRENPKQTCRLSIGEDTYRSVVPLLKTERCSFASLSQLVETIVFLSEHICVAEPADAFAIKLAKLKGQRVIDQIENPELLTSRFIHVTLDEQAIVFIDSLVERYPMLFRTRSDVVELLLLNVGSSCTTSKDVLYFANRLADVLSLHPTRSASER